MPFENLSADGEQDYFSRGFIDDLIGDLSRFSNLAVIASHSTASDRARNLHADFFIKGTLCRLGDRLRVTSELSDATTSSVVWAERFDRQAGDIFAIQDEISARVVAAVSSRIHASVTAAAKRKPVTELVAYDYWLQGFDCLRCGTVQADEQARLLFRKALECDPSYARAYLGLSLSHFNEWSCQLWERWDDNECRAYEYAARALELDSDDHYAQLVLGRVLLYRREFERAEQHLQRAVALNANDADCLVQAAMASAYLGRAASGRELYERARKLNPFHEPWYFAYGGIVAFAEERFEDVLELAGRNPPSIMVDLPAHMAIAHHNLGHRDEARRFVELYLQQFCDKITHGRAPEPGEALRWLQHTNPYRREADECRLLDGIRAAGLGGRPLPASLAASAELRMFRQVGSVWQMSFAARDVCLPHLKGFSDIATLLGAPGQRFHCAELMGAVGSSSDDDQIDERARAEYVARVRELRQALDEAKSMNDSGRAELIQTELDSLVEYLSAALGLGRRPRKLGAPSERARSAVTQRIRAAIRKIEDAHEVLGRHLSGAIETGTFCVYQPEGPVDWRL